MKNPSKTNKNRVDLNLGPLPVDQINAALGLELEVGEVVFSSHAQAHSNRSHPGDFEKCLPHVGNVVANPLYVGDDFRNPNKIELISRISVLKGCLLVAIVIEPDENGNYHVASMYPKHNSSVESRKRKGHLFICK